MLKLHQMLMHNQPSITKRIKSKNFLRIVHNDSVIQEYVILYEV